VKRRHFPPTASETRERERESRARKRKLFFSGRAAIKEKLARVLASKKGITNHHRRVKNVRPDRPKGEAGRRAILIRFSFMSHREP
jgi:hypothetical protein